MRGGTSRLLSIRRKVSDDLRRRSVDDAAVLQAQHSAATETHRTAEVVGTRRLRFEFQAPL